MHIVITGAAGFIGQHLSQHLLQAMPTLRHLSLLDLQAGPASPDPRVQWHSGSYADDGCLDAVFARPVDLVFHLAALPSGATEKAPDEGYRINVDGTHNLLKRLKAQGNCPRLVFTSSIAVYGRPETGRVDDDTPPRPSLSYGAQKVMAEALICDYSRREWIHACCVRIPGIVARPPEPNGAVSIFFSDLIRELAAGRPVTCPVGPQATSWLMSVRCCVENLMHAATLTEAQTRPWCLPATHVRIDALVEAIADFIGNEQIPSLVNYAPDPWVEFNFGSYPAIECPQAEALGFTRDESLESLIAGALQGTV